MSNDSATNLGESGDGDSGRGRSTIDFPYFDQDESIAIAQAVHAVGGTSCNWDQLAAKMQQSAGGGGFRTRVMAARTFGLLTYDRGSVTLTELGTQATDPKFSRGARAHSFLNVPLFKALYEKLKGSMLPPPAAIESQVVALGVAPKQKDRARQVFMRSAKQAGYFDIDQTRLTFPPNVGTGTTDADGELEKKKQDSGNGARAGGNGRDGLHPFIQGLLDKLPAPDADWPMADRAKWLQTAANIFDLMYKSDEKDKSIAVTLGT